MIEIAPARQGNDTRLRGQVRQLLRNMEQTQRQAQARQNSRLTRQKLVRQVVTTLEVVAHNGCDAAAWLAGLPAEVREPALELVEAVIAHSADTARQAVA